MKEHLKADAQAEIDEYFEQLVPAELTEQQMRRLAAEFREFTGSFQPVNLAQAEAHRILQILGFYLDRALERQDVDPRLRLDILTTLCWRKREESLDALPDEFREPLVDEWLTPDEMRELWESQKSKLDAVALARFLTWWTAAQLVSNAVHLSANEAIATLQPLLHAFKDAKQGLSETN